MQANNTVHIKTLTTLTGLESQCAHLLRNCVESGASVGFLSPLAEQEVTHYWADVEAGLQSGSRQLYAAFAGDQLVGAVQLALCSKANGSHRGEVEKLMVHTAHRGRGISKLLMAQLEAAAHTLNLRLLVLDTRLGDPASTLYRAIGYTEAGQIPEFARASSGELAATVYFYKLLQSSGHGDQGGQPAKLH